MNSLEAKMERLGIFAEDATIKDLEQRIYARRAELVEARAAWDNAQQAAPNAMRSLASGKNAEPCGCKTQETTPKAPKRSYERLAKAKLPEAPPPVQARSGEASESSAFGASPMRMRLGRDLLEGAKRYLSSDIANDLLNQMNNE